MSVEYSDLQKIQSVLSLSEMSISISVLFSVFVGLSFNWTGHDIFWRTDLDNLYGPQFIRSTLNPKGFTDRQNWSRIFKFSGAGPVRDFQNSFRPGSVRDRPVSIRGSTIFINCFVRIWFGSNGIFYSIYRLVTCGFSGIFGLIRIVGSVKSKWQSLHLCGTFSTHLPLIIYFKFKKRNFLTGLIKREKIKI